MATLASLVPLVRQHVTSCPDFSMEFWLLQAAREFCRASRYLRETISIDSVDGTQFYALTPVDSSEEAIGIKAAEWLKTPIDPVAPEEVPQDPGTPAGYWYLPSKEIALSPTPDSVAVGGLTVSMIVQPTATASSINDALVVSHDMTLAYGAMSKLFAIPKQDWSDPSLSTYYKGLFEEGKVKAQVEADTQHRSRRWHVRSYV